MFVRFHDGGQYVYRAVESFTIERDSYQAVVKAKVHGVLDMQEIRIDQKELDKLMDTYSVGGGGDLLLF